MSRSELMALLAGFAGLAPPAGHDQDDWDAWLVDSVLERCRRAQPDEAQALVAAIGQLRPLKAFAQLQPHLEARLGRPLSAAELADPVRPPGA
jgi:hypothetical protein